MSTKFPNLMDAVHNGRGVERSFVCDVHDDHSPSASVNVEKGVWVCYACGASGRVGSGSTTDVMRRAISLMKGQSEAPFSFEEKWLDFYDAAGPSEYWAGRFGPHVARRFRCGTDPMNGLPTYPLRSPSRGVWGVVRRLGGEPKYLYPAGVPVGHTLFNFVPASWRTVVVVEGASDVMACYAAGVPEYTLVVGTFGAGLNAPQVRLVNKLHPRRVVIAYDNDEAGRVAASRHYDFGASKVLVPDWPDGATDPGEMPRAQLKEEMVKWTK